MPATKTIEKNSALLREEITSELQGGGKVSIPGIGILSTVDKPARMARNPHTGGQVQVPAKRVVKFTLAKALKEALN